MLFAHLADDLYSVAGAVGFAAGMAVGLYHYWKGQNEKEQAEEERNKEDDDEEEARKPKRRKAGRRCPQCWAKLPRAGGRCCPECREPLDE